MVDYRNMDLKEVLENGIRSEIEAQDVYNDISEVGVPTILKNKLKFIINEEKEHERILRSIFNSYFPDEDPKLPEESIKPSPSIDENIDSVEKLFEQAMESEKDSQEFYRELAESLREQKSKISDFNEEPEKIARYLAQMERGHYHIFKNELKGIKELSVDVKELNNL